MNDNKNYRENLLIKECILKMILTVFKKLKKDVNIFQGGEKTNELTLEMKPESAK